MHQTPAILTTAILLCLSMASLVFAQEDDPYQPTPTTLPELIEDVGLEAIDWDVWTVEQYVNGFEHARELAFVDGDVVVFAQYVQSEQECYADVYIFSSEGRLLEWRMWSRAREDGGWADGRWHLQMKIPEGEIRAINDNGDWEVRSREFALAEGSVPFMWLPLVIQYHMALGHEQFEVPVGGVFRLGGQRLRVQHFVSMGDEELEVLGEQLLCRVFEYSDSYVDEDEDEDDQTTEYRVYTHDGLIVRDWLGDGDPEGTGGWRQAEPGVTPEGLAEFSPMLERDIGNDVFGVAGGEEGTGEEIEDAGEDIVEASD